MSLSQHEVIFYVVFARRQEFAGVVEGGEGVGDRPNTKKIARVDYRLRRDDHGSKDRTKNDVDNRCVIITRR